MKQVPTILIVSDCIPSKTRGGVSQTIYNLFDWYPADRLFIVAEHHEAAPANKDQLNGTLVKTRISFLKSLSNRIGKWGYNKLATYANAVIRDITGVPLNTSKMPDYILLATTYSERVHLAYLWSKKYKVPVIPYFLDDWMATIRFNWGFHSLHGIISLLLSGSNRWLMISPQLESVLKHRYGIEGKSCLVVHNPVSISHPPVTDNPHPLLKKIVYAGSIFDMHLDALLLTAKAVYSLNAGSAGPRYQLIIYTTAGFWKKYEALLMPYEVVYGGFIHPDDLEEKLREAWLLLVAASFDPRWAHMSRSSIQTKTTEYMRTGVPILSVGPEYGACNWFVQEWQAGFVFNTPDDVSLSTFIAETVSDTNERVRVSQNAFIAVQEHFSKKIIQANLQSFLLDGSFRKKLDVPSKLVRANPN